MKKVKLRLSNTAPEPTWVGDKSFSDPTELVVATKRTQYFCHYFDENGKKLDSLDDALIYIGIEKKNLPSFKKEHGLFNSEQFSVGWHLFASVARNFLFIIIALAVFFPKVNSSVWEFIALFPCIAACYATYRANQKARFVLWTCAIVAIILHLVYTLVY